MNVGFSASVMRLCGLAAVLGLCMVPTVLGQDVTVSKKGYEHRIVPGDRLRISVAEDKTLTRVYAVAGDGTIDMDYIGRVGVGDRRTARGRFTPTVDRDGTRPPPPGASPTGSVGACVCDRRPSAHGHKGR